MTTAACSVSSKDDITTGSTTAVTTAPNPGTTAPGGGGSTVPPNLAGQQVAVLGSETGVEQQNFQSSFERLRSPSRLYSSTSVSTTGPPSSIERWAPRPWPTDHRPSSRVTRTGPSPRTAARKSRCSR